MKPAILFGGDVTSYVLWAIDRGGTVENLGELWVRSNSENIDFSTGQKAFAMMVTAESHPLVSRPSELVLFTSNVPPAKKAPSEQFVFTDFAPAPKTEYTSIAGVGWNESENLDVRQAEKAYELAVDAGASDYAASLMRRAHITLAQARNLSTKGRTSKEAIDYSRRSVALSSEALQTTERKKEAARLEVEIAARKAEMEALESRAADAEQSAAAAKAAFTEATAALDDAARQRTAAEAAVMAAQQELERLNQEKAQLEQEKTLLEQEKMTLQQEKMQIEQDKAALQQSVAKLAEEKQHLSSRLQGALSLVAETRESARGTIVNLPDILFDTNESTLKPEAKIVIAKLAGILLILPDLNLRIEGHTDSTGNPSYNQTLSEKRAASVRDFLAQEDISMNRMIAVGYGLDRPVADNSTKDGRAKNRRVEIVIAEGTIAEATGAGQ
jgi:outer membrane protein OmpA-like peptidoglycan-associated protein